MVVRPMFTLSEELNPPEAIPEEVRRRGTYNNRMQQTVTPLACASVAPAPDSER